MRSKTRITLFILSACLLLAGCRGGGQATQPEQGARPEQTGPCPAVEGSYFGSDKSEVQKGEAVSLSVKLPREYVNERLRVEKAEGGGTSELPFDLGALQEAANPPALEGAKFPVWIERGMADVRPEVTTKYVLKAAGPQDCQPFELSTTVTVVK